MSVRAAAWWLLGSGLLAGFGQSGARAEPTFAVEGAPVLRAAFIEVAPEPAAPAPPPVPLPHVEPDPGPVAIPAGPPAMPQATAVVVDPLPAAIEARLADARLAWPPRLSARERAALAAAYRASGHRALWITDRGWTARGQALAARLAAADEDALDPAAYPVPTLAPSGRADTPADLAEAELKLSALAVLYARDARGGRLEPSRLSPLITPKLDLPGPDAVLARLAGGPDPGEALRTFNPPYPGYRALRDKLAELRANRPAGPLARALPDRRASAGRTIAVLGEIDGPSPAAAPGGARLEADIVANMERWRWLPAEIAPRYIAVNVPEFQLRLLEEGRVTHEARVIVGKAETPTPIVSGLMGQAVVNPSWYIPPSIMKNEILPGLARDPDYATRRGYEVIRRGGLVTVRQPPGERNALGFIKFLFPNDHSVYIHDTPNRSLFGSGRRAFSHGCVRVDQPFRLAEAVLGRDWGEARLKRLIGHGERSLPIAEKLPVHLTYFTVEVDPYGGVRSFEDLYGFHRRVRVALGLGA